MRSTIFTVDPSRKTLEDVELPITETELFLHLGGRVSQLDGRRIHLESSREAESTERWDDDVGDSKLHRTRALGGARCLCSPIQIDQMRI